MKRKAKKVEAEPTRAELLHMLHLAVREVYSIAAGLKAAPELTAEDQRILTCIRMGAMRQLQTLNGHRSAHP